MKNFLRLAVLVGAVAMAPAFVTAPAVAAPSTNAVVGAEAGNAHGHGKSPACGQPNEPRCAVAAVRNDKKPIPPTNVSNNTSKNTNFSTNHNKNYSTSYNKSYNTTYNRTFTTNYNRTYDIGHRGLLQRLPILGGLL